MMVDNVCWASLELRGPIDTLYFFITRYTKDETTFCFYLKKTSARKFGEEPSTRTPLAAVQRRK